MRRLAWAAVLVLAGCRLAPRIQTLEPTTVASGQATVVRIEGDRFGEDTTVSIGGQTVELTRLDDGALEARVSGLKRGTYPVVVRSNDRASEARPLVVENAPPTITVARRHLVTAGDSFVVPIETSDFDGDPVEVTVEGATRTDEGFGVDAPDEDRVWTVFVRASDGIDTTTVEVEIESARDPAAPHLDPYAPVVEGNVAAAVELTGRALRHGLTARYDGAEVPTEIQARRRLTVELPPRPRGRYVLEVDTATLAITVGNSRPVVAAETFEVDEGRALDVAVEATDPDGDTLRRFAVDLPPGATFDPERERLRFEPDFIQGGRSYTATFAATDGAATTTAAVSIFVVDRIRPPEPEVVSSTDHEDHDRVVLAQHTDAFLDPDGRTYEARLVVPHDRAGGRPLRVYLHGFGGRPYDGGRGDVFALYPHDEDDTYWWGKDHDGLTPYTARRVLHLVGYVLDRYDNVDPNRVYVFGPSMGGAGAVTLGAVYARHFAYAYGTMGQMIPRRHRPSRIEQLTGLWGAPSADWDHIDIPRLLVESREAKDQFFITRHGKDDPIIHFGAVLFRSPVVKQSYYEAVQSQRVGHYAAWDEGAHGPPDPVLGAKWWEDDWDPSLDPVTRLERDRAFVAFSGASHDGDPGRAKGDGRRPFDPDRGYAGELEVVDDQGWGGDRAGTFNRRLRWDSNSLVDTLDTFEVKLRAKKRVTAIATPRRVRRFVLRPGERVRWRHGRERGTVAADAFGVVSIPVKLSKDWSTLRLERE